MRKEKIKGSKGKGVQCSKFAFIPNTNLHFKCLPLMRPPSRQIILIITPLYLNLDVPRLASIKEINIRARFQWHHSSWLAVVITTGAIHFLPYHKPSPLKQ